MAVLGRTRGRSSAASCSHSCSASGSLFIEILLEEELRGDGVDVLLYGRLGSRGLEPAFRLGRAEAFIHARDGQAKAALQLPREALDALRERVCAALRHRQADDEAGGPPLMHQLLDLREAADGS